MVNKEVLKDTVVSFETAKLAYSKGFRDSFGTLLGKSYYNYKGVLDGDMTLSLREKCKKVPEDKRIYNSISAPTQSLLHKWLISKTMTIINVYYDGDKYFSYKIGDEVNEELFPSYEEAFERGLYLLLERVVEQPK